MLGSILDMHFMGFLTLAVISLIASLILHYVIRYRVLQGMDGFLWKWVVAWFGAWLGSPVLGDWFSGLAIGHVYVVPAFLGAFIGAFLAVFVLKAEATVLRNRTSS